MVSECQLTNTNRTELTLEAAAVLAFSPTSLLCATAMGKEKVSQKGQVSSSGMAQAQFTTVTYIHSSDNKKINALYGKEGSG